MWAAIVAGAFGRPADHTLDMSSKQLVPIQPTATFSRVTLQSPWTARMDRAIFDASFSHMRSQFDFDVNAYISFVKALRREVKTVTAPVYIIEAPVYIVEHLLPLFFAVPGWLVRLKGGHYSERNAKILQEEFRVPSWAILEMTASELRNADTSNKLFIACTEPRTPEGVTEIWRLHPNAVTLAHGVDEDPIFLQRARLHPPDVCTCAKSNSSFLWPAPEQWRDLRTTNIFRALLQSRLAPPQGMGSIPNHHDNSLDLQKLMIERLRAELGLAKGQRTVLYISTIGEYEFLERTAKQQVGQQVWQALVTLKCRGAANRTMCNSLREGEGYNVLVSLHPMLRLDMSRGLRVHVPSKEDFGQCVHKQLKGCKQRWSGRKISLVKGLRHYHMLGEL